MNPYQQGLLLKQQQTEDMNQLKELNRREDSVIEVEDSEIEIKQSKEMNFTTRFEDLQTTDNRFISYPNISNNTFIANNNDELSSQRPTLLFGESNKQSISRPNEIDEQRQRLNLSFNLKDEAQSLQDNLEISFRGGYDMNTPRTYRHSVVKSTRSKQTKFNRRYSRKSMQEMQFGLTQHNNSEVDLSNQSSQDIGHVSNDIQIKKSKFNNYKNVNLVTKIMKKMQYFYRNYTDKGKLKNLNIPIIRQMINDKSDLQTSTLKKVKLDKIKYYWKKIQKYFWRLPIFSTSMINPQHIFSICLQIFFIASNFYYFTTLSLILIFQKDVILSKFYDKFMLIQWIIEVLIKLNTAVFMKTNYIDTRKEVLIFYSQKKAIFDIIPILLVSIHPEHFIVRQILRFPQFLKFHNTLKDKQEVEQQLLMVLRSHYIVQLTNLVLQLFFVGHIIACCWYFIGKIDQGYLDAEKSWMTLLTQEGDDWSKIYILSFYWAFTLMATGSNIANTTLEVYFTSIIMLFTTIVFGYMVNEIGIILSDINQQEEIQRRDINIINNYMEKKDIPKTLQRRVNLDLENYYLKNLIQKSDEEKEVLSKISKELNEALKLEYNKNILSEIKLLFDNFSEDSLKQLCLEVEEVFFSPEQIIFKEEDLSSSLMYIVSGKVEIFQQQIKKKEENQNLETFFQTDWGKQLESEKYSKRLGQLKKGKVFGEQNFFTGMSRNESAKSKDFTTIIKIDRQQFIDIIKDKEKDFQTFCEIKDKLMLYNDYSSIKQKCIICNNSFHINNFCPQAHFHKDNQYILQRFNQSLNQERNKSFVRKKQQKVYHSILQVDNFFDKVDQLWQDSSNFNQLRSYFYTMNSELISDDENQKEDKQRKEQDDDPFLRSIQKYETQNEEVLNKNSFSNEKVVSNQNITSNKDVQKFKSNYNTLDHFNTQKTSKLLQDSSKIENEHSNNSAGQSEVQVDESILKPFNSISNQNKRYYDNSEEQYIVSFYTFSKQKYDKFRKQITNNNEKISFPDITMNLKLSVNEVSKSKTITSVEKRLSNAQNKRTSFKQNAFISRQSTMFDRNKQKQRIQFENISHEEKKQQNLQWTFDQLKDFTFYFPQGNSKYVLSRLNFFRKTQVKKKTMRSQFDRSRAESIIKKQSKI